MKALTPLFLLVALVPLSGALRAADAPAEPQGSTRTTLEPPASPDAVVRPGKAKGAWQGEYPIPKPPLPEGPAAPPPAETGTPALPDDPPESAPEPVQAPPL